MKFLYWAEGGFDMGFGHLSRSRTLSLGLGFRESYYYAENDESIHFFKGQKYELLSKRDALMLKDFVLITDLRFPENHSDTLIKLKKNSFLHLAIIDLGLSQIDADIIVDGHIKPLLPIKVREGITYLLGSEYFILSHRFRHFNKVRKKIRKKAKKIFMALGGGVRLEQLMKLCELIGKVGYSIEVAFGFGKPKREKRWFRKNFPFIKIAGKVEDLSRKYYEADISITAGGVSYYESAATGTPSIYFYKDSIQEFTARTLEEEGFGIVAGDLNDFDKELFLERLRMLTYAYDLRKKMSEIAKSRVDALSIKRIRKVIKSRLCR